MSTTTPRDDVSVESATDPASDARPVSQSCALSELPEAELLAEASEAFSMLRELEVHRLRVAYEWAVSHPAVDAADTPDGAALPGVLTGPDALGGQGTPAVAAFTAETLAVATSTSSATTAALMADALDLVHRFPILWNQVQAGFAPAWKARRVAAKTRDLSFDAAGWVDRHLAGRVSATGSAMLNRMIAQAVSRCDGDGLADRERRARECWDVALSHPGEVAGTSRIVATGDTLDLTRFHDVVCAEAETLAALGDNDKLGVRKARALGVIADQQARLDLAALLGSAGEVTEHAEIRDAALDRRAAKTKLYLHASLNDLLGLPDGADSPDGTSLPVGTVESLGPATLDLLKEWVGRARVTIQPVLHVAADDRWSVDRHDPPPRMADQVRLRDRKCVFPWCSRPARACDMDHVEPYEDPDDGQPPATGSPPGQTTPANLAPLCRRHHRAKTSGRWRYQRLDPGEYLWRGPNGNAAMVTQQGTIALPLN